jgi:hypothetical protein
MNYRIFGILAALGLLLLIVLYAKEVGHFNRTLDAGILIRNSAFAGAVAGAVAGLIAVFRTKVAEDRLPAFFMGFFFCVVFAPLFGGLSNRHFAGEVVPVAVEFHMEEAYFGLQFGLLRAAKKTPAGYRSFFYLDGRLRRIQASAPLFSNKRRGDVVQLNFKKGYWGFDFVPAQSL